MSEIEIHCCYSGNRYPNLGVPSMQSVEMEGKRGGQAHLSPSLRVQISIKLGKFSRKKKNNLAAASLVLSGKLKTQGVTYTHLTACHL